MQKSMGVVALLAALVLPTSASAFCGFYVSGADASLFNNASVVVLMRDGTRTVVSMQNDYQGPPEDFALVVPVPVVLSEDDVRTLPREVFGRVDRLAAPRLVEYWEQDPCYEPEDLSYEFGDDMDMPSSVEEVEREPEPEPDLGVTVEAEFAVGEYDIVILGARDSSGLETWLRREGYRIPEGAARVLRPYVEEGMKFFVARVSVERVTFEGGRAVLSPLRFHYESEQFFLPVRLGTLNSNGSQDVLVHVLARGMRYEVANLDNYAIPTNLVVSTTTKEAFGGFYRALFDRMLETHPGAAITEYSWDAGSCDPCPEPPLTPDDVVTLGADVIPSYADQVRHQRVGPGFANDFVLTRIHVRVSAEGPGEDLVFRPAPPIEGGRGTPGQDGELQKGVQGYGVNNFQGRYVILHPWEGEVACEHPRRGVWGAQTGPMAGGGLAFAPPAAQPVVLGSMLAEDVPELGGGGGRLPQGDVQAPPPPPPPPPPPGAGCASCAVGGGGAGLGVALLAMPLFGALARRRRRRGGGGGRPS